MKPGLYVATELRGRIKGEHAWCDGTDVEILTGEYSGACFKAADAILRPLVVLDPESDEDVTAFYEAWSDANAPTWREEFQQALRALAAPKSEEPTGLGAVVRDRDGLVYTLVGGLSRANWCLVNETACRWLRWDQINSPEVLSPGWSE